MGRGLRSGEGRLARLFFRGKRTGSDRLKRYNIVDKRLVDSCGKSKSLLLLLNRIKILILLTIFKKLKKDTTKALVKKGMNRMRIPR